MGTRFWKGLEGVDFVGLEGFFFVLGGTFGTLKILFHYFLASTVAADKLIINH